MKTLTEQLSKYAEYHRDRRNIATHFVGVPMIVLGIVTLLARASFATVGNVSISPALIAVVGVAGFYIALERRFGVAMTALMVFALWGGTRLASGSTLTWLGAGIGLFVVGWAIQFVGHAWEGRKPAFVDDLIGLLIGPLFVVAEAGFILGLRRELRDEIERRAGPTRVGRDAAAATNPVR